ncbi:hypothetical protein ACA910_002227 [Epithemia clementina (nom. ined.)]
MLSNQRKHTATSTKISTLDVMLLLLTILVCWSDQVEAQGKKSLPPSEMPSEEPSFSPSLFPSGLPSDQPSYEPSTIPSDLPSTEPSTMPSTAPTSLPSSKPSTPPTVKPSFRPSATPSYRPTPMPLADFQAGVIVRQFPLAGDVLTSPSNLVNVDFEWTLINFPFDLIEVMSIRLLQNVAGSDPQEVLSRAEGWVNINSFSSIYDDAGVETGRTYQFQRPLDASGMFCWEIYVEMDGFEEVVDPCAGYFEVLLNYVPPTQQPQQQQPPVSEPPSGGGKGSGGKRRQRV